MVQIQEVLLMDLYVIIKSFFGVLYTCKFLQAEGSSAESIATLSKVDTVKRRMEAAFETLQVRGISAVAFFIQLIGDHPLN